MPRLIHCLLLALLLAAFSSPAGAAESDVTARNIFALLPESIFENTPEGLSPQDKQKLLTDGHSEFWEVAGETEDVLVFASLPFRDTAVALRLLRNSADGSVLAAFGTLGGSVCTLELWRVDATGRAVPVRRNPTRPSAMPTGRPPAARPRAMTPTTPSRPTSRR